MLRTVTISGSYSKHFDRITSAKQEFEALGVEVLRPVSETVISSIDGLVRLEGDPQDYQDIHKAQLQAISGSDLLYVVNPGGYVGSAATLEIGYAHALGIPIATSEKAFEAAVAIIDHRVGSPTMVARDE